MSEVRKGILLGCPRPVGAGSPVVESESNNKVVFEICMINLRAKDVYDGIPTVVTTFVAIIPKISIFIFLLELVHYTSQSMFEFN
jgi:hypothetical protein